ncbi:hypothetical protein, partial [Cronobacter sakazakii]|uniref:hypothetical protein n=1 Tax=Cronobacter sakazakii TaxID=28141 RepID=UPI001F2D3D09
MKGEFEARLKAVLEEATSSEQPVILFIDEICAGEVPPSLRDVRLLSLDIVALSAGASMKGEFEARLKAVLEEATSSEQPVILFIDEI